MAGNRPPSGPTNDRGEYPNPGSGLRDLASWQIADDFKWDGAGAVVGELGWTLGGTGVPVSAQQAPTARTEIGIVRLTTTANANDQAILSLIGTADMYREPSPGSTFACKFMPGSTANIRIWMGFASTRALSPDAAGVNVCSFVGIRAESGGNVKGVVRAGATETARDLGVAIAAVWQTYYFRHLVSFAGTSVGFQFSTVDASKGHLEAQIVNVGAPVVTNFPVVGMFPIIGIETLAQAAKTVDVDFYNAGGKVDR